MTSRCNKPYMSKKEIEARLGRGVDIEIVAQLNGCTVDDICRAIGKAVKQKCSTQGPRVIVIDVTTGRQFASVQQAAEYFGYRHPASLSHKFHGMNSAIVKGHRLIKQKVKRENTQGGE